MRATRLLAVAALAALPRPALATDPVSASRSAQGAVETVLAAMDRGYGARCSLANQPVQAGGYYPCLDIGPYRFVREYGRVRAYVLVDGQQPYPILVSANGESEYAVSGRWSEDLPTRVAAWWDDEVLGNRGGREMSAEQQRRYRDADAAVGGYQAGGAQAQPQPQPEAEAAPGQGGSQGGADAPVPDALGPAAGAQGLRERPIPTRTR